MNIEEYMDEVLGEAYEKIKSERMGVEMSDFMKIEQHMQGDDFKLGEGETDFWYLTATVDVDAKILNEDDATGEEQMVLGLKYKMSYRGLNEALADWEIIKEMKNDGAVGIITRSNAVAKNGDAEEDIVLTTLTTPLGVYFLSRTSGGAISRSYPKDKIVSGNNRLVDSLIDAFFCW